MLMVTLLEFAVLDELDVVIDGVGLTVSLNKVLLGILSDLGVTVQDLLDVYNSLAPGSVEGAVEAAFAFQADPTPDQIAETVCLHYVRYKWELL